MGQAFPPAHLATVAIILTCVAHSQTNWRPLFNGDNLEGWSGPGAAFAVDDGAIRTQTGGLLRYTREKIGDVTLRVVYRISKGNSESSIVIRDGEKVRLDTGVIDGVTKPIALASKAPGEWNTMDITIKGAHVVVKLNDVLVTDHTGRQVDASYIAIEHPNDRAVVYVREVSVQ